MYFGGIQRNTLIDYPGKLSCVLFLSGCNFSCPYCHNPDLARGTVPPADRIPLETVFDFLESRRGMLEGVVLSGGEPTLENRLEDICTRIKALGYAVKLDTNGSRPDILTRLLDAGCLDYIAMDIKAPPAQYPVEIAPRSVTSEVERSIQLLMTSGVDYEFRTTCAAPFADERNIAAIARRIQGARRYVLQVFNPATVLDPEFFNAHPRQPGKTQLEKIRHNIKQMIDEIIIR
jgi:pyruvate formate lyase activating enzyme